MRIAGTARRDLAPCVDDAMPRHVAAIREIVQGVADLPRMTIESGQRRYLTVCGDAPARDAFYDGVDACVAGVGSRGWGVGARHRESLTRRSDTRPPTPDSRSVNMHNSLVTQKELLCPAHLLQARLLSASFPSR